MLPVMPPWFSTQENAVLGGVIAGFLDGGDATGPHRSSVSPPDTAAEDAHGLAAETGGVLDPALDVVDLGAELVGRGQTEVAANGGAADVQPQPGATSLEAGEISWSRLGREVVFGQFYGVHGHTGGSVDEVGQRHLGPRLTIQRQVPAITIRSQAQPHARPAGAADGLDGAPRRPVSWRRRRQRQRLKN